ANAVLREAAELARRLCATDAECSEQIASCIYIPLDPGRGMIRTHDRFTPDQPDVTGPTPEPLAGLFPFEYTVEPRVERATMDFYLDLAKDYVGRPMLSALLCVFAARLGDRAGALRLLQECYGDFVQDPFGDPNACSTIRFPDTPRVGPFMATAAG